MSKYIHFDVLVDEIGDGLDETAAGVHRTDHLLTPGDHSGRHADAVIVLAEVGRLVDDARTRFVRNVRVRQDLERSLNFQLPSGSSNSSRI